jgi:hypothetical protein
MKRLMFTLASLFGLSTPALAADLDGPVYRERETYIERPAPPVVERERIIERYYYHEPRVETYVVPRVYERPVYADRDVYDDEYRYHRPTYFVGRPFWWHRHHHGWRW